MIPVIMPRQGQSVESCVVTKWHVKQGDTVSPGDPLFSYETDKAAFDEEAKEAGTVLVILRPEGDDVPCLENVMLLGAPGEDVSAYLSTENKPAAREGAPEPEAAGPFAPNRPHGAAPYAAPAPGTGALPAEKISPRARALAVSRGADLSQVLASGPGGRVIARDVQALLDAGLVVTPAGRGLVEGGVPGTGLGGRAALRDAGGAPAQPVVSAAAPEAPESRDEPLTTIRKLIARAMRESLSAMAQLTHTATFDATGVLSLRKRFKEQGAAYGMQGVTIGDLVVFAVSRTLMQPEHRALNAHFLGDFIRYFRDAHIGIAVDTPRGLMVPVLRDAGRKSLLEISTETKALAAACQASAINPDLLAGGTFTVSNLGAFEVEHFTPVINPPQTGILGVNTIQQRVRERDGQIEVYSAMSISLTYDHRALDGAPASRFLRDLKFNLENIHMLLGGGAFHV